MGEIKGVTAEEGRVIRAASVLGEWKDVCGIGRETLGRELTKHEAWEAGRSASVMWREVTGMAHPSYALMPKRFSGSNTTSPAHLKAVYPPSWVERIEKLIRVVASRSSVANGFEEFDTNIGGDPLEGTIIREMFGNGGA